MTKERGFILTEGGGVYKPDKNRNALVDVLKQSPEINNTTFRCIEIKLRVTCDIPKVAAKYHNRKIILFDV